MTYAQVQDRINATVLKVFGASHVLDGGPVQGQFVRVGKTFALGDGVEFQARVPLLVVASADVPESPVGMQALCEDELYSVQECRPDGLGLTVLELERVPE